MKKEYDLRDLKKRPRRARATEENATKVPISLRIDGGDLADIRDEADRLGIPYQTLLGSIIHRYINGELVEKKTVAILKKLVAG